MDLFAEPTILIAIVLLAFTAGRFSTLPGFLKRDRCAVDLDSEELSSGRVIDALLLVDPWKGKILFADERAVRFYGMSASRIEGRTYAELMGMERDRAGTPIPGKDPRELHYDAEGKERLVEVNSSMVRYRMRHAILVALRSVEENSENERASEVRKAAIDATYNGVGILRKDGRSWPLVDANPALVEILEMPREEVLGADFFDLLPDQEEERSIQEKMKQGKGWKGELRVDDGREERWFFLSIDPMRGKGSEEEGYHAVVCQDITEKRRAETQLVDAIVQTQQQERKRVANDLHDGVGQTLTAANVYLKSMEKKWKKGEPERGMEHLPMISDLLNKGVEEIRNISHDLMPDTLKEYGLVRGLRQICREADDASEELAIHFNTKADPEKRWEDRIEGGMYRICQEIVNNTLKHSEANSLVLSLTDKDPELILEARDDGRGFDPDQVEEKNGAGLRGLKERAQDLGGDLRIDTEPGKGTYFKVTLSKGKKEATWEKNTLSA